MSAIDATPPPPAPLPSRWRRGRLMVLGLAISATLLYLVLAGVDRDALLAALGQLRGGALIWPLLLGLAQLPQRPWRWATTFPPAVGARLGPCFRVFWIGNVINYLLPGRGGDLARCLLLRRFLPRARVTLTLATLGIEKLLDAVALLAVLSLVALSLPVPPWLGRLLAAGSLGAGMVLTSLVLVRWRAPWLIDRLRGRAGGDGVMARLAGRLADWLGPFADGLAVIASPSRLLLLAAQTALIVVTDAAVIWSLARALQVPLSLGAAAGFMALVSLAFLIPSAPGFVGTYEAMGVVALGLFGLAAAPATALTLVTHAWTFVTTLTVGGIVLAWSGIGLRQSLAAARAPDATG